MKKRKSEHKRNGTSSYSAIAVKKKAHEYVRSHALSFYEDIDCQVFNE